MTFDQKKLLGNLLDYFEKSGFYADFMLNQFDMIMTNIHLCQRLELNELSDSDHMIVK